MEPPRFTSVDEYAQRFTDAAFWRRYVEVVCRRHHLEPCSGVEAGLPGSNPVFRVDDRSIVKFYPPFFNGPDSYAIERALYDLFAGVPDLPTPKLLAHGELCAGDQDWRWPYLVVSVIPGTSLGEVHGAVPDEDIAALARFLGPLLRRLHSLPLPDTRQRQPTWDAFGRFLQTQIESCVRNHSYWGTLPPHLVGQIPDYLPPLEKLIDRSLAPSLLHCDLNWDHVMGQMIAGHWTPTGIIDFGDAKVGDRAYEFVALHLGLFRADKRLLRLFLDSDGLDDELCRDFTRRAMSFTLLHEFNVLDELFQRFPRVNQVQSLDELATLVWEVEARGLEQYA